MKKFLSLFVVLALVLAMLPMAVFAEAEGTLNLTTGDAQYVELLTENSVELVITTADEPAILTVDGEMTYYDWYIDNGMQMFYPEISGSYIMELEANTTYNLMLVSDSGFEDQMVFVSVDAVKVGSENCPAELNMGENSATVDGNGSYFFTWTAAEVGQLTIAIDTDKCSDWSYQLVGELANGTTFYGETNYSDLEPVVSSQTVTVYPGDTYVINVNTSNYTPGSIYFNASFTSGVPGGGEGDGEGGEGGSDYEGVLVESDTVFVKSETGKDDEKHKVVEYIAPADGTVYITMSSPANGWSLMVYKNGEGLTWMMTSSQEKTYEYPVHTGDTMTFEMGSYDAVVAWGPADDEISYVISFMPGEVEIEKEEYVISDIILYEGDNDLTMIDTALNTLFEFTPTETGIYTFTAPAGVLLGDWGQFFNPMDHSGVEKTNTLQWTCTDVGQSVLVGVFGDEDIVLNVERTGDYVPAPVVEWKEFQISVELDYYEQDYEDDFIPVNVTDSKPETAVLGADGYYHLNSADGPILFIDLNQYVYPATGYGNVGFVSYDEEGNIVDKISYTNAVIEYYGYSDSGIYPLTADLIEIYKNYGTNQGWYDPNVNGFYLFNGAVVDPETAWMFACYYDEDKTSFLSEYYVAGEAGLCGSTWTPGDPANQMIMNFDGTCSITYPNVAAGTYMFKVTQTDWDLDSWGGDGPDGNYVITLNGTSSVTINFDPETGVISVIIDEIPGENPDEPIDPPVDPDEPIDPPVDPDEPVDPPVDPDEPIDPPVDPDEPVDPPVDPDEPVDPPVIPDEPNPGTIDYSVAALVVAMMAATTGAVVLTKKKED